MATEQAGRRRLGRGLAALIGEMDQEVARTAAQSGAQRLAVASLQPNPGNPRRHFAEQDLDDLTRSIREKGVLQPIVVRPIDQGRHEIIAGERRWRAAQRAGLHDVPVVVFNVSDREALEIAIVENVQRADLDAIEEAMGYQKLIEEHGYPHTEVADIIGKSRSHVSNSLRLLRLPADVQSMVQDGSISAGHARAIATSENPVMLARRIAEKGLSVRQAERLAQSRAVGTETRRAETDPNIRELEKSLSDHLGFKTTIRDRRGKGEVRISYRNLEQLDAILNRLRG